MYGIAETREAVYTLMRSDDSNERVDVVHRVDCNQ